MQTMNFKDADSATTELANLKRKWVRITDRFTGLIQYWSDVATTHLGKIVAIDQVEEGSNRFTATTLGKNFTVEMTSIIFNGELYGRILIHTPTPLNSSRLLAGEVLLSDSGKILSPEGAVLADSNADSTADYQLLCEIIRVAIAD